MSLVTTIFSIVILVVSVMFHELAHGTVADMLGDPTPRLMGRLTLNPLVHMELFGSFLLPLLCVISGSGFIIGWAKPVPFNPSQLKFKRWGPAFVAAAGPAVNIVIAGLGAIGFRVLAATNGSVAFAQMLGLIVMINISLAVFNLVPIPPLDGHHVVGAIIPAYRTWSDSLMQRYRFVIIVVVIVAFGSLIAPVVSFITRLLLIS